tara:strand:+ start:11882 stop:13924 length:2043 start_codon:yes stop_codon:yes gene_type:complete
MLSKTSDTNIKLKNYINVFIASFSFTFLVIIINFSFRFLIRKYYYSEFWDKSIYLFSIFIGLYYFKKFFIDKNFNVKINLIILINAFLGLLSGLLIIENNGLWEDKYPISEYLWSGFGMYHLLLTILISLVINKIYNWDTLSAKFKYFIYLLSFLSVTSMLSSFWQTTSSLIEVHHNEYVINDLLSIRAGNWPYENYITEYQNLFAFLTIPFSNLDINLHIDLALILMYFFSIIAISLGIYLVKIVINSWALAVMIVIPLTLIAPFPIRRGDSGTIAAHLNAVSGRLFLGIILLYLTFYLIVKPAKNVNKNKLSLLIGFISGLNIWSNQDFSLIIIATILTIFVIVENEYNKEWFNKLLRILVGLSLGILSIPILYKSLGHSINLGYVGYIAEAYINGHGSKKILPGPVFIILPLIISLNCSHLFIIGIYKYNKSLITKKLFENSILGILFSGLSALGFVYYMNLSSASIQLQILLLPISISLGAFIGSLLLIKKEYNYLEEYKINKNFLSVKFLSILFVSLIISTPLASILTISNPISEISRINSGNINPKWPNKLVEKNINHSIAALQYSQNENESVGYFGYLGNYISIATGIKSTILFNNPKEFMEFNRGTELTCNYLKGIDPTFLVVELTYGYTSDEGESSQVILDIGEDPLCGSYKIFEINNLVREGNFAGKLNR